MSFFFLAGLGVAVRLFFLQVVESDAYQAEARQMQQAISEASPQRGEIFMKDKDGRTLPLAVNKKMAQIYAVPLMIKPEQAPRLAEQVAEILGLPTEVVLSRLMKPHDPYEPLKSRASEQEVEAITSLNVKGLKIAYQWERFYPLENLGSQVVGFLGFAGKSRKGQYGLEGSYEELLAGQERGLSFHSWASLFSFDKSFIQTSHKGVDIVVNLDPNISFRAKEILQELVDRWQPESGTILVMNPETGAILAMEAWPDFNPNNYSQVEDFGVFLNAGIQKTFEPGSVFKPVTMACGLEKGVVTPQTHYEDQGWVKVGGHTIRNVDGRAYGWSSMTKVLELSLNTGAVFVQQKIGKKDFLECLERFGLGKGTGIDLDGEVTGDIANLRTGRAINYATASFGQGISLTSLQLVRAVSAIANGGKLMKPYLVSKVVYPDGQEKEIGPVLEASVISPQTAARLTSMLVSVVEKGYGKKAGVKGFFVAGKTGTAQVPKEQGGYWPDKVIHTFAGFAPAFDPKFVALIKLSSPKGARFAADTVAPAFHKLAKFILNYYEIPPER